LDNNRSLVVQCGAVKTKEKEQIIDIQLLALFLK
jgi:hypothetical protein